MKSLTEVLAIAKAHAAANGSAGMCYADALFCAKRGNEKHARLRAQACVGYAVGVFHADFNALRVEGF